MLKEKGVALMEALWMIGIVIGWIVLNRWILPRMGVQT